MDMSSRTLTSEGEALALIGLAYVTQASFFREAAFQTSVDDQTVFRAFQDFSTAGNGLIGAIAPAPDRPMHWVPVEHDDDADWSAIQEFEQTCDDVEAVYTVQTAFGTMVSIFMTLDDTRAVYFRMEFG